MISKSNLIQIRQTLSLAQQGYELLEQKQNVLAREALGLKEKIRILRLQLTQKLDSASKYVGIEYSSIPTDNSLQVHTRRIMGVEIPTKITGGDRYESPPYSLADTSLAVDEAANRFRAVKNAIIALAVVETAHRRLELAIKKTQKRANALEHIIIPDCEARLKFIQNALEERERDGFVQIKKTAHKIT